MTKDVFAKLILRGQKTYERARVNMIKQQIRTWEVFDDNILLLCYTVPREDFVPPKYKSFAFADISIPLGHYNQSMMTPKEEARVLQELHIQPGQKILVLGADSGYLLTLLANLGKQVFYFDNDIELFEQVKAKLAEHHVENVMTNIGSLQRGWQEFSPFDIVVITGSLPETPDFLKTALTIEGKLFVVVGELPIMEAMIITRLTDRSWGETKLFETVRPRMMDVKEPNTFRF